MSKIFNGMKYFRTLNNNNIEIIRITSSMNPSKIRAKDCSTGNNVFLSEDDLKQYTRLNPDALLQFSIVKVKDMEDVIVTIYRYKEEILNNDSYPYCVCRQNITDLFTNTTSRTVCYGMSISKDTKPVDVDYKNILACDGIEYNKSVAVYIDDKLSDILSLVKSKMYDNALHSLCLDYVKYSVREPYRLYPDKEKEDKKKIEAKIKKTMSEYCIDGYCKTLKDLLEYNNFMYDFHMGFGIYPLNIDLGYIDNGSVCLSPEHMSQVSDLICKNIYSTIVLRYSKYIDLEKISKDYILVSDMHENLYIISYKHRGDYRIPLEKTETDDNIMRLSNIVKSPKSSVQRTLDLIRINGKKYV